MARRQLLAGIEPRMKGVYDALAQKDDGPSLAMRARLRVWDGADMRSNARGWSPTNRRPSKLRIEDSRAARDRCRTARQRALKAAADDPSANLAMADALLQAKPIEDVQRYLEAAKRAGEKLARSIGLADALTLSRDTKLDEAKELVALDGNGDARVQQELALVAFAQGKPADAKPFVDQISRRCRMPRCRAAERLRLR